MGLENMAWPCYGKLEKISVNEGHDPDVYKWVRGDDKAFVVHVYKRGPRGLTPNTVDCKKLDLYVEVQNQASNICVTEELTINFPISKERYPLRIVKFKALKKCSECGNYEALSAYLPGKNLNQYPYEFDRHDLKRSLLTTGYFFEEKLGVRGIQIDPVNIKRYGDVLIISDLCAKISELKKS